ncbi:MAG: hypothetical protein WKG07_39155 [Hymenobacter sp.]
MPPLLAIALTVVLGVAALLGLLLYHHTRRPRNYRGSCRMFKAKLLPPAQAVEQWLNARFGITNQKLTGYAERGGQPGGGPGRAARSRPCRACWWRQRCMPVYIFLLFLYQKRLVDVSDPGVFGPDSRAAAWPRCCTRARPPSRAT